MPLYLLRGKNGLYRMELPVVNGRADASSQPEGTAILASGDDDLLDICERNITGADPTTRRK